jgi:pimeloyl-ACP methyl ester carboxylesterase
LMMGKQFVLLHGAWHGGWCWDGVKRGLEAKGHSCITPTMPGHGPDDSRQGITYDGYVKAIEDVFKGIDGKVILAGHSSAGHLMQCAAPLVADKIERLVFINSFILPHDHSQFDIVPPEVAQGMTAAAQASPDMTVPIDEGFVRGMLMQDASQDQQDELISDLVPQPLALFTSKINAQPFEELKTPRKVIFCKDDQSLPPGAYLGMAQGLGEFDLIEVPGGHETLFVNPAVVVDALIQAAE